MTTHFGTFDSYNIAKSAGDTEAFFKGFQQKNKKARIISVSVATALDLPKGIHFVHTILIDDGNP